ncbi:hypothetical protein HO133_001172 [Letharia lupina]|uniref:Rhodopsin domain-containing protein n=1 Tax=Letharia lupina TaxID=560253 RepID=A0A8H6CF67_9LECA|nr:uncharacterized protein HO133_001172 [Letharia lupina]KAF6222086.1 hypothetical protein HO133_001172 [Letharia lupina]
MAAIYARDNQLHGRGVNLAVISIVFTFVAICLVCSRLASRLTTGRKLHEDDYAIIASVVFSIGLGISNVVSVAHGAGKVSTSLPPEDLRMALQAFWAAQILYKFTITLTKTSICLLYLRIFTTKKFRQTVHIIMGYVILYSFASIIATIVQCTPLERIWDHAVPGTCINLTAFWYANASANIIGDFLILALPMPVVRSLQLPQRQRLGLVMPVSVCITSILRMTTLKTGSKAKDQIYGTLNSTIWTTIEANTAIICACLPMLKSPLTALFPRLFPRGSADDYSNGSNAARRRGATTQDRTSPPAAYDGWGRLESKKPSQRTRMSTMISTAPARKGSSLGSSSEDTFRTDSQDVPMGNISKTTHVDVQYGNERMEQPVLSPKSNEHARSISATHLVGEDFSFP